MLSSGKAQHLKYCTFNRDACSANCSKLFRYMEIQVKRTFQILDFELERHLQVKFYFLLDYKLYFILISLATNWNRNEFRWIGRSITPFYALLQQFRRLDTSDFENMAVLVFQNVYLRLLVEQLSNGFICYYYSQDISNSRYSLEKHPAFLSNFGPIIYVWSRCVNEII